MENQKVFIFEPQQLTKDQIEAIKETMKKHGYKTDDNYVELETKEIKF